MAEITWDQVGERVYETGVDHGVLYRQDAGGAYANGYAWNGLTAVTESPSGAEATPQYADNIKYLNLVSAEEFGGTIEAFTYPDEFAECDGTATPSPGVSVGQQTRKAFGLAYRSLVGNDVDGTDYGYKLHLIYGALAAPSEKAFNTVNDSPEAITFSWEVTTTPVEVPGMKPSASITIDSTKVDAADLASLEQILYGTPGVDPRLPLPAEVLAVFSGALIEVIPTAPTLAGNVITIPTVTGVEYKIDGEIVTGTFTMTALTGDVVVTANPITGYIFPAVSDDDWFFNYTP
jgi:hypothetical protein